MTATMQLVSCLAVCGIAALTDWRSCRIPNWLTLSTIGLGLGLGALSGVQGIFVALVGALVCGLAPLLLCLVGAMGGGDFKLLAAVGALLGARLGLEAQAYAFAAASVWGLGVWLVSGRLVAVINGQLARLTRRDTNPVSRRLRTQMRFAPSVLVGVAVALARFVGVA